MNQAVYVLVNDGDNGNEMTGCSFEVDGDYLSFCRTMSITLHDEEVDTYRKLKVLKIIWDQVL